MMEIFFLSLIIIVLFIYPKHLKTILQLSFTLILLAISLWSYHQWEMYKRMKDPNVIISCHPEWCGTWLCPERRDCRGCDESGGY